MSITWPVYSSLSVLSTAICLGNGYNFTNGTFKELTLYMFSSRINILVLLNLAICTLFLFGKVLQLIFFGQLRDIEAKNIYDRLLNYVLFKIVFLGAILEPSRELLVYICCFSVLGFMKIFSLLARDRFEYIITFNPNSSRRTHAKLLFLLILITVLDVGWFYFCIQAFKDVGAGRILLVTFECFTLFLDTIQTLIKYVIHIIDVSREGIWEQRGTYIYYTEFCTDILVLVATLGHYIQILLWHGFLSPSLIDLVLFLHLRIVFNNLREKITSYRNYRKLAQDMKTRYPDISGAELGDDICAICHDNMEVAKKLPCSHVFHHSCLRSWLEHHYNCPTCRYSLLDTAAGPAGPQVRQPNNNGNGGQGVDVGLGVGVGIGGFNVNVNPQPGDNRETLFRFNGSRWLSWLPTIQVVSERRNIPAMRHNHQHQNQPQNQQHHPHQHNNNAMMMVPQEMIRQLSEVFPHIPPNVIAEDLLRTHSVDLTTENILEGRIRIPIPPPQQQQQQQPQQPQPQPQQQQQRSANSSASISNPNVSLPVPVSVADVSSPSSSDIKTNFADVFATSSSERQNKFEQRKQAMLEAARLQFIAKQKQQQQNQQQQIQSNNNNSNQNSIEKESKQEIFNTNTNNSVNTNDIKPSISNSSLDNLNFSLNSTNNSSSSNSISSSSSSTSISNSTSQENIDSKPDLGERRRLFLEAAEKRANQQQQQQPPQQEEKKNL